MEARTILILAFAIAILATTIAEDFTKNSFSIFIFAGTRGLALGTLTAAALGGW